jgi:hypothetical protein
MGNFRFAAAILFVAACGNDHAQNVDAAMPDTKMVDAKVWMDAPPPTYDFSCYMMTPGTTVDATITITGTVGELSQTGLMGLGGRTVTAYKVGANTPAGTTVSSVMAGSEGEFSLGPITTNGTAIEYVRAADTGTTYRTTYLYPPNPLRSSFDGLPVPLIDQALVGQLETFLGTQNDTDNGMLFVAVNDCSTTTPTAIDGAEVKVQQNSQDVGNVFDVGQFIPEAAGTFIVLNVPDGDTEVSASYNGMTFPTHTVAAYKKPMGPNAMGTVTVTAVPPGPIN